MIGVDEAGRRQFLFNKPGYGIELDPMTGAPLVPAPAPKQKYDLSDPEFLKGILNPNIYSSLQNPDLYKNTQKGLYGQGKTSFDYYKPTSTAGSDSDFSSYLSSIQAPSSVDAVWKSFEQDYLQQVLGSIGRDTESSVAKVQSDMQDRGLGGAGRISDIEANTVAQARAEGGRTAAEAWTQLGMAELGRQKAREDQRKAALGQKYQAGLSRESQANQIGAQGAMTSAQMMNELLGKEYAGAESAAGRQFTGAQNLASLQGADRQQYYNQLMNSLLQNKVFDINQFQFAQDQNMKFGEAERNRKAQLDQIMAGKTATGSPWDKIWQSGTGKFVDEASQPLAGWEKFTGGVKNLGGGFIKKPGDRSAIT